MFSISAAPVATSIPMIVGNYRVLHYEDEDPILFVGTNQFGSWIIGSSVEEDDNKATERFFHVLVTYPSYSSFLNRKISYRKIIESSDSLFVIEKPYNQALQSAQYLITPEQVPSGYLPLEDSFCPPQQTESSFSYVAQLHGGTADRQSAHPSDLNSIQALIGKVIEKVYVPFGNSLGSVVAEMRPATSGSFELNYKVRVDPPSQGGLFPDSQNQFNELAQTFIRFCINDLPEYLPSIAEQAVAEQHGSIDRASGFDPEPIKQLLEKFFALYGKDDCRQELFKLLCGTSGHLRTIAESVGPSFKTIGIANRISGMDGSKIDNTLGVIDDTFRHQIEEAEQLAESRIHSVVEDDDPKKYEILIYHLNTESRSGNAMIVDDSGAWSRPRIKIDDAIGQLTESPYTLSLHQEQKLKVKGIARRVDGRFKEIKILGTA